MIAPPTFAQTVIQILVAAARPNFWGPPSAPMGPLRVRVPPPGGCPRPPGVNPGATPGATRPSSSIATGLSRRDGPGGESR